MEGRWRKWRVPLIILAVLVIFGSIYVTSRPRERRTWVESGLSELLAPAQTALSDALYEGRAAVAYVARMGGNARENAALKQQIASLQAERDQLLEYKRENETLRRLLGLEQSRPYRLVTAEVIARPADSWFDFLVINRGSSSGIKSGQPVLTEAGVVGRILSTTAHTARVLLLSSPRSATGGLTRSGGELVLVEGKDDPQGSLLTVEPLTRSAHLQVGDVVVTSGFSDIYPKGLPVAQIVSVAQGLDDSSEVARAAPFVDFGRLEWVSVALTSPTPDEAAAVAGGGDGS
ncbi:MAG TPA: rod shape-determining protein MreC [Limnochordia bacterium]|nr:rod shape-determining protein MreC [Limnochordia bacterium]